MLQVSVLYINPLLEQCSYVIFYHLNYIQFWKIKWKNDKYLLSVEFCFKFVWQNFFIFYSFIYLFFLIFIYFFVAVCN